MSANQFKTISLAPELKQPNSFDDYYDPIPMKEALKFALTKKESKRDFNEIKIDGKTPALGSKDIVTYPGHDAGFLSTVLEAYNDHYNLRTGPEDWWYTIIQTVAVAIDKNAKEDSVRKFFVEHEGKKPLEVRVGPSIYGVDYSWFFGQMSEEIAKNINVPQYVKAMETDFSSSTKVHKIVGKIVLMKSVQEYFEYTMVTTCCGIPAIEMKGTEEDWRNLGLKTKALGQILFPIWNEIGLGTWWMKIENITTQLLNTYQGNPDKDWWSRIITEESFGSGERDRFEGWFMTELLNMHNAECISDAPSGIVTVPMTIVDDIDGYKEESAIVAGMVGYKQCNEDGRPLALEAVHGWSLFLEPTSRFRNDLISWEEKSIEPKNDSAQMKQELERYQEHENNPEDIKKENIKVEEVKTEAICIIDNVGTRKELSIGEENGMFFWNRHFFHAKD